jgi:uncharacterized membrane protein
MRILVSGHGRQLYLIWNLFLAWVPLILALIIAHLNQRNQLRGWLPLAATSAWLIFFPNAPYILTDLIHLRSSTHERFWVDLLLILLFGFTGLVLGFLALYLMQQVIAQRLGRAAAWFFIPVMAGLAGFGIYLGRFLRWNSWDILLNPFGLLRDIGWWLVHIPRHPTLLFLPMLFAILVGIAYVLLYALTHLTRTQHCGQAAEKTAWFSV